MLGLLPVSGNNCTCHNGRHCHYIIHVTNRPSKFDHKILFGCLVVKDLMLTKCLLSSWHVHSWQHGGMRHEVKSTYSLEYGVQVVYMEINLNNTFSLPEYIWVILTTWYVRLSLQVVGFLLFRMTWHFISW